MVNYEIVLLARQDISSGQVDGLIASLSDILKNGGGSIAHQEYCGLKALSYRIRKNRKAHYVLLDVKAPAVAVKELERLMKINEDILRFLTVKVDNFGPRPSALSQSRYSRDDRSHRDEGEKEALSLNTAESSAAPALDSAIETDH